MDPVRHIYTPYTRHLVVFSRGRTPLTSSIARTVHYSIRLMLSHLHTILHLLHRYLPTLSPAPVIVAVMRLIVLMSSSCSHRCLKFKQTWAQLLHSSSAYSLDESFANVLAEEIHLGAAFTRGIVLLLSLTFSPYLSHPPLLILCLLHLSSLDLLYGQNGLLLVTIMAY